MTWLTCRTAAVGALATMVMVGRAPTAQGQRISQVPSGQPVAGISCDAMEGNRIHIHQHLTILDKGKPVPIPFDVGRPASGQCLYWVHTHTPDGVIHIESPSNRTFTLGDFFQVWGQPLTTKRAASAIAATGSSMKVWVDGKAYAGDPGAIALKAHTDIVIEIGPPFPPPPKFTDWVQR
jgi:hypothetical protein